MIDVILYGKDQRGRLTLQERSFGDLRELSSFLFSPKAARWEWAEIEHPTQSGRTRTVQYTTDALRELVISASRLPSLN
jgi:hypothetical protein